MSFPVSTKMVEQLCADLRPTQLDAFTGEVKTLTRRAMRTCRNLQSNAVPVACIQLIAQQHGTMFDKRNAIKIACITAKLHEKTVRAITKACGVTSNTVSVSNLSVQLGKEANVSAAKALLARLQPKLAARGRRWATVKADENAALVAAAMYHMARKMNGATLSKEALRSATGITNAELTSAIEFVGEACEDDILELSKKQPRTGRDGKKQPITARQTKSRVVAQSNPRTGPMVTGASKASASGSSTSTTGASRASKRISVAVAAMVKRPEQKATISVSDACGKLGADAPVVKEKEVTAAEKFDSEADSRNAARKRVREAQQRKDDTTRVHLMLGLDSIGTTSRRGCGTNNSTTVIGWNTRILNLLAELGV